MKPGRGRIIAICSMLGALGVLVVLGLNLVRKREGLGRLLPEPAPAAGGRRASLGIQVFQKSDGTLSVSQTAPGSPAEKAGVRPGDVLRGYAGKTVSSLADIVGVTFRQGERVPLVVTRNGREVRLTLIAAPLTSTSPPARRGPSSPRVRGSSRTRGGSGTPWPGAE